jgi:hypothetical protein
MSDIGTVLGACIAGAIPQVVEIDIKQAMREGSLENIFPDSSDGRLDVYAFFPSRAPSRWES